MDVVITKEFLGEEEDADLVEWLVAEGSTVAEGDPIAQLETSKIVSEYLAPGSGVISFKIESGDLVSVDDVIATIA